MTGDGLNGSLLKLNLNVSNFLISNMRLSAVKFMFSEKAKKIDEIFDLTLCSKCQIDGEDFIDFCGLLRKHEL